MNSRYAERVLFTLFAAAVMLTVPLLMMVPDESEATILDHSDEYYYNQLSEKEQGLYRQIYGAAVSFRTDAIETGFTDLQKDDLGLYVLEAVRCDHPELIQLTSSYSHYGKSDMILKYSCTEKELKEYIEAIETFCDSMVVDETDRYSIVTSLNTIIGDQAYYDKTASENYEKDRTAYEYAHNIKGIFVDGKAVCEGYALAFKYLCDLYDIPCICITGDDIQDGKSGGHMWNYVKMGSVWYAMDVTWNDSSIPDKPVTDHFTLVGSETVIDLEKFSDTHVIRDSLSSVMGVPDLSLLKYTVTIGDDDYFDYGFNSTYYLNGKTADGEKACAYNGLTVNGKKAYEAIVKGLQNFDTEIDTGVSGDMISIFDASRAVHYDRQDLFQYNGQCTASSSGKMTPVYTCTQEQYEKMSQEVMTALIPLETELSGCATVYDKVSVIHDYLVSHIVYDKSVANAHDIYGALVKGKCVCEGYARAFQYVCTLYGITAICVSGDATNSSGTEAHMWNMVLMNDGKWYEMDVTWDDPLVNGSDSGKVYYDYFLVGTETKNSDGKTFSQSHVPRMGTEDTHVFSNSMLPTASETDYYIRPGSEPVWIVETTVTGSAGSYKANAQLDALKAAFDLLQGHGSALIDFGEGNGRVGMSAANLAILISYMEGKGMTEVDFTYDVRTDKITLGPLETENVLYKFGLKDGSSDIALESIAQKFEVTLYIPFEKTGAEVIDPLIFAWDSENAVMPKFTSKYADGYVSYATESLESSYFVGSTPIKDVPVLYVIAGIAGIMLVLFLLARHHSKKKARKAAKRAAARRKSKS